MPVLITGATSEWGAAMPAALLNAGAVVAITGRQAQPAERAAAELMVGLGCTAVGVALDVGDESAVDQGSRPRSRPAG